MAEPLKYPFTLLRAGQDVALLQAAGSSAQEGAAASLGQSQMAWRADASQLKHLRRQSSPETTGETVLSEPHGKRAVRPSKEVPRDRDQDRWDQQPTHAGSVGCGLGFARKSGLLPGSWAFPQHYKFLTS